MSFVNKIKEFFKKKEEPEQPEYIEVKEPEVVETPVVQEEVKPKKPVRSNAEIERDLREFYKNRKERNQFR